MTKKKSLKKKRKKDQERSTTLTSNQNTHTHIERDYTQSTDQHRRNLAQLTDRFSYSVSCRVVTCWVVSGGAQPTQIKILSAEYPELSKIPSSASRAGRNIALRLSSVVELFAILISALISAFTQFRFHQSSSNIKKKVTSFVTSESDFACDLMNIYCFCCDTTIAALM